MKIFDRMKYKINQYVILLNSKTFPNSVTISKGTEVQIVSRNIFNKTYSIVYNGEIYDGFSEIDFTEGRDENRYVY